MCSGTLKSRLLTVANLSRSLDAPYTRVCRYPEEQRVDGGPIVPNTLAAYTRISVPQRVLDQPHTVCDLGVQCACLYGVWVKYIDLVGLGVPHMVWCVLVQYI